MKFDNLDDLQVMVATAETASFTLGGRRCGLSTAAVSAAIKRLETGLGVRLFDRTTRRVQPTREGLVMIDYARRALELVAQGQALVCGEGAGLQGTIRITAATALVRGFLADWLAALADEQPGLSLELLVSDTQLDLVREGIDIALRHGPLPDSGMAARLLVSAHRIACASPAYLARHGLPKAPAELARHECLIYQVRGKFLTDWSFQAGPASLPEQVSVKGRLRCNDASIAHQWALQGRGVAYLSGLELSGSLCSGALQRLFAAHQGEDCSLYAVLPSRRFVPPRVSWLMDALAARLRRSAMPS
jgi:DNA-binding transcriptional LysR family regulator